MTDIAEFVDRVQPRRRTRRAPFEPAQGMRGVVSGLDSAAMMDNAQGVDIMEAAPDTRLGGSAPARLMEGGEGAVDILPGGRLQYANPADAPQADAPVQDVGLFGRRGGVVSRPSYSPPQARCVDGQCGIVSSSQPVVSGGQVFSQGSPMVMGGQVISSTSSPMMVSEAVPAPKMGDMVNSTLQMQMYDIDPTDKVEKMPMYTPDSLMRAGLQAFDYAEDRLGRGDKGAAIAALQGFNLAKTLLTESSTMFQDRQTFKIMEARAAQASEAVRLATPAGKLETNYEMLADQRFSTKARAMQYAASMGKQMGIEGLSPEAQKEMGAAITGVYQEGLTIATGLDISHIYITNKIDRPSGGAISDPARQEQAEISRTKALNLADDLLTSVKAQPEQFATVLRETVGRQLERSLTVLYASQGLEDAGSRAVAEADEYATTTARAILERRAGGGEE